MKLKKPSGEGKALPVHNKKKTGKKLFHSRKKEEKKEKLTVEQEILRMRDAEKKKKGSKRPSRKKDPILGDGAKDFVTAEKSNPAVKRKKEAPPKKEEADSTKKAGKGTAKKKKEAPTAAFDPKAKVRVIPLGGLGEIGKNMTVVESDRDMIVIDCGMGFPDDGMPGIDLVIPDVEYLEANREKIRGIFLTHGHEDHIGAIPYVLQKISVPIYGTKLTLGIVENKLEEFALKGQADLRVCSAGDRIAAGDFSVELIGVNHSIADSVAFAVGTPCGTLVFTGDFKIDPTPISGEMTDLTRFGELGKEGVTALFCDSTNCERMGFTPSERTVGTSLEQIFHGTKKRVIVATFSSNIHRVQQIIDASIKYHRAVCILGRSMTNIVETASKLGYMKIPEGTLVQPEELKKIPSAHVTLITTGSQGEAMSALSRIAFGTHSQVKISPEDMVVISAHPIPGNEKTVGNIINELMKKQVEVVYDRIAEVHVSGHACQEEIKLIFALTRPRFFMPVHGEYKHLARSAALAEYVGIPRRNVFISEIGRVLEFSDGGKSAAFAGSVPSGKVLVDGLGVGDVGSVVLRDRKLLSEDGIITVVAAVDSYGKYLVGDLQIVTRGFVYVKENEDLIEEIRTFALRVLENSLSSGMDLASVRNRAKEEISKFLYGRIRRRPMIVPVLIET